MAKTKNYNPPETDPVYQDGGGIWHYFGEFVRGVILGPYPDDTDTSLEITGSSRRGRRPSQQGPGSPRQVEIRKNFEACAALWNSLPDVCPDPPTTPPTTSKASVWQAKQDFGVVCSYYDLFMRCCMDYALSHSGAMPQGDCFPCGTACNCDGILIGYTTLAMQKNEQQTLTVQGAVEGCVYSWDLVSGGGSLDAEEGVSVVYTAPATNPNCENNAIIALSVNGEFCDEIPISVNAWRWDDNPAFEKVDSTITETCGPSPPYSAYCKRSVSRKQYNCKGVFLRLLQQWSFSVGMWPPSDCSDCWDFLDSHGMSQEDLINNVHNSGYELGQVIDVRTQDMITGGCCYTAGD